MRYLLQVTDEDIIRIAAALCHYSDILTEVGDDQALDSNEYDKNVREWSQREGHDVERLNLRMQTLAHMVQATQAMTEGNSKLAEQRAGLAGKALADYKRMTV
jgi:hypothetical protein